MPLSKDPLGLPVMGLAEKTALFRRGSPERFPAATSITSLVESQEKRHQAIDQDEEEDADHELDETASPQDKPVATKASNKARGGRPGQRKKSTDALNTNASKAPSPKKQPAKRRPRKKSDQVTETETVPKKRRRKDDSVVKSPPVKEVATKKGRAKKADTSVELNEPKRRKTKTSIATTSFEEEPVKKQPAKRGRPRKKTEPNVTVSPIAVSVVKKQPAKRGRPKKQLVTKEPSPANPPSAKRTKRGATRAKASPKLAVESNENKVQ